MSLAANNPFITFNRISSNEISFNMFDYVFGQLALDIILPDSSVHHFNYQAISSQYTAFYVALLAEDLFEVSFALKCYSTDALVVAQNNTLPIQAGECLHYATTYALISPTPAYEFNGPYTITAFTTPITLSAQLYTPQNFVDLVNADTDFHCYIQEQGGYKFVVFTHATSFTLPNTAPFDSLGFFEERTSDYITAHFK